jgi:hypothetical protein
MVVELYPHQKKAVRELHNGSILWGDVGTGKSLTAAAYYMENYVGYGEDFDVIVITTAKKRDSLDWQGDFAKFGVGPTRDSTVAGTLTVDSWNNLSRYRDVAGSFFIFDEQRVVGSGEWTKDFIRIASNNRWILLSATPGDTWLDYIPVFVANGFYKNRTEFLREHVVYNRYSKFPKVDRYLNVNKLVKLKNQILVEMPMFRHTTRITKNIETQYDQELFRKVLEDRWHVYENRPLRDVAELFSVMRKVVNSDTSRSSSVATLLREHPKVIVFYNFDYELNSLRQLGMDLIESNSKDSSGSNSSTGSGNTSSTEETESWLTPKPAGIKSSDGSTSQEKEQSSSASAATETFLPESSTNDMSSMPKSESTFQVAEWNGHKHQPVPTSDSWLYLVQYVAGSEGWNCITTDTTVFYSLTYSYKNWHQAHGRTDRLNTPYSKLYYYVLTSNSVIDKAIMRSLMGKKSFNEKQFLSKITTTHSQRKDGSGS